MIKNWIGTVRSKGQLRVAAEGLSGGNWGTIYDKALKNFNLLMKDKGINLELVAATKEAPAADVTVRSAAKQASFNYSGGSYSKAFDGNGMHGLTVTLSDAATSEISEAHVFVPATPRITQSDPKSRLLGAEGCLFILVHELIHAAGLDNAEHTLDDVFCYPGEFVKGNTAADDRLQPWGGLGKPMPPFVLSSKTIAGLQQAWP